MKTLSASRPERAPRLSRAGFSLLEMLLAIAIAGMVTAIMLPSVNRTLESSENRRAAFHFQRLVLDLRATAFREEQGLVVVDTGQFDDDPEAEPRPAEIVLEDGWDYRLASPLTISARGLCDAVDVDLSYRGRLRMRLHGASDCNFTWERATE